ncbi:uncharacterized protein LOC141644338 [Silene latifolia]|uniref:uncharacterized protein LOC141644338 n=1 Tax=Silene latifolia TaxID=37657 RepID=UPI003D77B49E
MVCAFSLSATAINGVSRHGITKVYMSRFCIANYNAASALLPRANLAPQVSKHFSSSLAEALTGQLSAASTTQLSKEWFALRKDKLTTSTFSTVMGFWKGTGRADLWSEKVFASATKSIKASAMEWGVLNEAAAIEKYKSITGHDVTLMGFAIHPDYKFDWLGTSPDGLINCPQDSGILEVKCPYNKGKPALASPWSRVPFRYMPQVQGQMEIMDRDWVDLYCWTPNGSTIFRVHREPEYWDLMHEILHEFWWKNVVPARAAFLARGKEAANFYKPSSKHTLTRQVISESIKLASEAKLLCKETGDHVEFYT